MSAEQDIKIEVRTAHVDAQSEPDENRYVFAYTIRITNLSSGTHQLLNRHWVITDASGEVEEVRGEGVVGQQPKLGPGEHFEYTSGAVLKTPVGSMQGEYEFMSSEGQLFLVPIEAFSLFVPSMVH